MHRHYLPILAALCLAAEPAAGQSFSVNFADDQGDVTENYNNQIRA